MLRLEKRGKQECYLRFAVTIFILIKFDVLHQLDGCLAGIDKAFRENRWRKDCVAEIKMERGNGCRQRREKANMNTANEKKEKEMKLLGRENIEGTIN